MYSEIQPGGREGSGLMARVPYSSGALTSAQVLPPHEAKTRSSGPSTVAIVPEDRTTPVREAAASCAV